MFTFRLIFCFCSTRSHASARFQMFITWPPIASICSDLFTRLHICLTLSMPACVLRPSLKLPAQAGPLQWSWVSIATDTAMEPVSIGCGGTAGACPEGWLQIGAQCFSAPVLGWNTSSSTSRDCRAVPSFSLPDLK